MFSAACQQLVNLLREEDTLIPVPSLDEENKVKLLQLVFMKNTQNFFPVKKRSYHPTEFQLTDVLQDSSQISQKETDEVLFLDYGSTIEFSWKGKVGFDLFPDIEDVDQDTSDTWTIQVKFGKVVKTKVDKEMLQEELMKRTLKLHHPFIEQVQKNNTYVLCLVTGVVHLTKESHTNLDSEAEASEKMQLTLSKTSKVNVENNQVLGLKNNTALAYNIHELDVSFKDGSIKLKMPLELPKVIRQRFFEDIGIYFQAKGAVFQAILDLTEKDRKELTSIILNMMSVPRDIQIFIKLVEELADQVEKPESQETQDINVQDLEKQFLTEKQSLLYLLKLAGITEQTSGVLCVPEKVTPLLTCFGVLFDALSGLQDGELDLIGKFTQNTIEMVLDMLEATLHCPIVPAKFSETGLKDCIVKKFLEQLGFNVSEKGIFPPKDQSKLWKVHYVMIALSSTFIKI